LYQKEKINDYYLSFARAETKEDKRLFLEALLKACDPLISVILFTRYRRHFRYHDDLRQEVLLRLWKNLGRRSSKSLLSERYTKNPASYLFFLIRNYVSKAFRRLRNVYGDLVEVSLDEADFIKKEDKKGFWGVCIFCKSEDESCFVNIAEGRFECCNCGATGDFDVLFREYERKRQKTTEQG